MTAQALEGLRVLDLTQVMAGPYCTMQLCDMGAEVIKVEPPDGDSTRRMAGSIGIDSPSFNAVNRGKRGIVLDLRTPEGQDICRRLARRADVVVENYRPGVMRRLGLDYATLAVDHPDLIYASISGYGQTGPYADKGGFDLVAQGVTGLMSVTGQPGGPPTKVGVPLTDLGAGLFALSAILAALHYRTRTGRGQQIDISLVDAGVALSVWEATDFFSGGVVPQPTGSAHRFSAPYQAIRCADAFITLAAANQRLFERLTRRTRPSRVAVGYTIFERRRARAQPCGACATHRNRDHHKTSGPLAARCSTSTRSRAGRSTTTSRCSPTRTFRHVSWSSRPTIPRSAGCARSAQR